MTPSCGETAPTADRIKCPEPLLLKAESVVGRIDDLALMNSQFLVVPCSSTKWGRSSTCGPPPNLMRGHLIVTGFYDNKVFFGASKINCSDTKIGLYNIPVRS